MNECKECGMPVNVGEYHPYAACLMFKSCGSSDVVQANLDAVVAHGAQVLELTEVAYMTKRGAVYCGKSSKAGEISLYKVDEVSNA